MIAHQKMGGGVAPFVLPPLNTSWLTMSSSISWGQPAISCLARVAISWHIALLTKNKKYKPYEK